MSTTSPTATDQRLTVQETFNLNDLNAFPKIPTTCLPSLCIPLTFVSVKKLES
jgi:hypothetical protein